MKTYKPVTIEGSDKYFVGCYDKDGFRGLDGIFNTPQEAIDAAQMRRMQRR